MASILFVCHGNICRSPAAEMILRQLAGEAGFPLLTASAATSREELGNGLYPPMRQALLRAGVQISAHTARQVSAVDYQRYSLIIGMDEENMWNLRRLFHGDPEGKLHLLMEWCGEVQEVDDPWYTRDFDRAVEEITLGCRALLGALQRGEGGG